MKKIEAIIKHYKMEDVKKGSVADRCKYLLSIHLTSTCAVIGMNSPLPFIPCGAKAWGMAPNRSPRHPLFCHRWFADDVIITCVRWYLRFKLSYRDLAELA